MYSNYIFIATTVKKITVSYFGMTIEFFSEKQVNLSVIMYFFVMEIQLAQKIQNYVCSICLSNIWDMHLYYNIIAVTNYTNNI